jgi:tetratricopeptide (TPR) repeat protein
MVARVARLESLWKDAAEADKAKMAAEIVKLSTTHRVLSDKTALLVLETEDDYARFKIDRKALADILVVGGNGLEVKRRDEIVVAAVDTQPGLKVPTTEDAKLSLDTGSQAGEEQLRPGSPADDGTFHVTTRLNESAVGQSAPSSPPAQTSGSSVPAPPRAIAPANRPAPAHPEPSRRDQALYIAQDQSRANNVVATESDEERPEEEVVAGKKGAAPALNGPMAEIQSLRQAGKTDEALTKARQWQRSEPGNVLALVALGECLQAKGMKAEAARAYGSIIDLFPSRTDLRRFAGSRLQALGPDGLSLAMDSFEKAVGQRPDHVSSHRYLALALARQGRYEQAVNALEKGLSQDYPDGRFLSYERILRDDLGIMGAAWAAKNPDMKAAIAKRLLEADSAIATDPSLRFVLTWETDANDVDFHIHDAKEGHAYYSSPSLPSGGELYGDVTTGYGPECFAIPGKASAFPYRLQIHYYSRGPMGYGMGQLEILQHDGLGHLVFEERPYIVMQDGAYVDLGIVEQTLQARR